VDTKLRQVEKVVAFDFEQGTVAQGGVQPLRVVVVVEVLGHNYTGFFQVGKADSAGQ